MYKLCLGLLFGALLTMSPCLASEDDSDELEKRVLDSAAGLAAAYKRFPVLYDQGNYELLIQEALYPGELTIFPMLPLDVQEGMLYLYDRYVGMACYKMAVKHNTDEAFVTEFTDNARRHLQHYLDFVRKFVDPRTSPTNLIYATQMHSAQVYGDLGVILSQLFPDKILKVHTLEEAKPGIELFGVCVLSLEQARKLYAATAKTLPNYSTILTEHTYCLFEALNKGLLVLKACDACIRPPLKAEIMSYKKTILTPLDKTLAAKIQAEIDRFEQAKDGLNKATQFRKLGPNTKEILRTKKANQSMAEISTTAAHITSTCNLQAITDPRAQKSAIKIMYFGLSGDCFRFQSQPQQLVSLEGRLYEMETLLSTYFSLGQDVKAIYLQLHSCFDQEVEHMTLPLLTAILMKTGNIEGAVERLEALIEAQQRDYGRVSPTARFMYAYNKLMMGDPELWLAYEKEKAEQTASKLAAKKKKKAAARQNIVDSIKETQAAQEAERERAATVVPQLPAPVVTAVRDDKGKEEAIFVPSEDFKTAEQLKAEKLARHKAKQEERARREVEAAQQPQMIPVASAPAQVAVVEDEIPNISLVAAYNLKSTAKKVDEEIENNTWNFTREQLKTYLKAMGCEYRTGRGSHEVMELPNQLNVDVRSMELEINSTHVIKDGKVITVFIDMDGSLSLPFFDKGDVRPYLRKHITSVRNQLKKLAYKAQQELEKAKE